MTIAQSLGRFVSATKPEDFPDDVLNKARTCVLNGFGIALSCGNTPYWPVATRAVLAAEGETANGVTLLPDGRRTTLCGAALANASLFHGRAQEDSLGAAHFGTVLLPLLTALSERQRTAMDEFLPALVAGYEAGGFLLRHLTAGMIARKFRPTAVFGAVAAAASVARFRRMSAEQTAMAISNAASFAGGMLQGPADGTDEWRYQPGMAASAGLMAATLAEAGATASPNAIEGPAGFARAFAGMDAVSALDCLDELGSRWALRDVTFKPYPVCLFNQSPVDAALELSPRVKGAISVVHVRAHRGAVEYPGVAKWPPVASISDTLQSMPFSVALALTDGRLSHSRLSDFDDPAVLELARKVTMESADDMAAFGVEIRVEMVDGRVEKASRNHEARDYDYDIATVSRMVRRIGREEDVPAAAFDLIEDFARTLPRAGIDTVLNAFALAREARQGG